jgi:tetratricopeptide (TPR) repeat protein
VVSGRAYDFAHDLVREVVYESIPEPTRLTYHRRAADLLEARPEALAPHAAAIGDTARAARAWLFAGEEAYRRLATADAEQLLTNALAAADTTGDLEVAGRAWLTRGRVREQTANFAGAIEDYGRSMSVARQTGDRRLEMLARQARGGDPKVALGQSVEDAAGDLAAALRLAAALGDREVEVALLARLGIVECNRLDFRAGLDYGLRAVRAARSSGEAPAVAAALDGLKTAYAYMGQIGPLETVLDELMPLLREQRDVARMQWAVHESGFIPLARGDWAEAIELFEDALSINRRSGYGSYECWFLGFIAWAHRLAGALDAAVDAGRRAVAASRDSSVWFRAASRAQLGAALLAVDDVDEATAVLIDGRDLATQAGSESYLLRCLGPLTEATARRQPGSDQAVSLATEFERRLSGIDVPDGAAWILGADCYFAAARGWRLLDRPDRAAELLAPLRAAAKIAGWSWIADSG